VSGHETVVQVLLPLALEGAYSYLSEGPLAAGRLVRVPLGPREVTGVVWPGRADAGVPERTRLRPVLQVLDTPPLPDDLVRFVDWVADYTVSPPGSVLRMTLRVPEALGPERRIAGVRLTPARPERMTPARARVIELMAEGQTLTGGDVVRMAQVSASVVKGLAASGTLETVELPALAPFPAPDAALPPPDLSPAQGAAAARVREIVARRAHRTVLIDGVTGAGKTEVYLEAVGEALRLGRQAVILLPEIALTAEFLARFEARFAAPAAEWHSGLARRERERVWRGVASGAARVVIGARSALFLPFGALGLVVIDEEHETAFKQEDGVIYHARDMGVVRAMLASAPAILASATPSLESHVNAEQGKYERLSLPERHGGAAMPAIRAVDLRERPPERGRWLGPDLVAAIGETLAAGEQSLLFLNRRGYAPLTLCRKCGFRLECPQCDAWLVEHRFHRELRCHHCGYAGRVPERCPYCASEHSLVPCGPGVERIVEEVAERFADARRAILSSDHLTGIGAMREVIAAIKAREVDILVGTQMVAKGHHFPNLTLVGVVDADFGLAHGDPRTAERTYQLLHQVAGRAGREGLAGRALLQTHMPEHPVLDALVHGGRDAFYEREAAMRQEAGLPPFGRLVALIVSAPGGEQAGQAARQLVRAKPHAQGIEVLGPADAPLAVIRGRHRVRFLVKARRGAPAQDFVRRWLARVKLANQVRVTVDVDPQSFL
jgi:primosomal protein N' (replication factor Y)